MFENVDGWTDERRTDDGVTGILLAHPCAFGSGELKTKMLNNKDHSCFKTYFSQHFLVK